MKSRALDERSDSADIIAESIGFEINEEYYQNILTRIAEEENV